MIVDRGHKGWAIGTGALLAGAGGAYAWSAATAPQGPSGGSAAGLAFGIAAAALMAFAALLGVRKKRPHYRLGRAATWLKGHLWLGALTLPLVLFHAGFEFGGLWSSVLMWTFLAVYATGLYGLALQQFLPRLMTKNVEQETVYEQIDHVRDQVLSEAVELVHGAGKRSGAVAKAKTGGALRGRVVESRAVDETGDDEHEARLPLIRFLDAQVRPYFLRLGAVDAPLQDPHRRANVFAELKSVVAPELHRVVDDLEALCRQRADLEVQRRLHHWLHGWLLLHVPLAWAMVALVIVHAVAALYY